MFDDPTFQERQRHTQWWGWLPILVLAALTAWIFVQQVVRGMPVIDMPDAVLWTLFVLFSVLAPLFLVTICLTTTVVHDEVRVRWWPLWTRRIPIREIETVDVRSYRAFREYGGYGPQWTPWRGWSYAARGRQGVQLTLSGKHPVLIGSQKADALAEAIRGAGPSV